MLGFNDAVDYYCQPLHMLDGDATNQANRWYFNQAGESDSLKYVVIDLENEYEIEKFVLYDAGNFEAVSNNIDGYNIYVATTAPEMNLISKTEDKNTVWTKVANTKGRRNDNIKTDIIAPVAARYVKLEIPRSRTSGAVALYEFEIYKKDNASGVAEKTINDIQITPNILTSGDNFTVKNFTSGQLSIFNLQGVLLMNKDISENETIVHVPFPAGTYVVALKSDKTAKEFKIIVK